MQQKAPKLLENQAMRWGIQEHKIMKSELVTFFFFQTRKIAERSMAKYGRKKHEVILGCPFRGVEGDTVELLPPGLGVGALVADGKGGSSTSLSVRTGYGASAGGRYPEVMSEKRLPA